jgi:hypothetical protein
LVSPARRAQPICRPTLVLAAVLEAWPPVKWAARPEGPWRLKSVVNKLGRPLQVERKAAVEAMAAVVAAVVAEVGVVDVAAAAEMVEVARLRLLG